MNMKKSFGMAACAMLLMMACTGQKGAAFVGCRHSVCSV